ncbi:MAG: sugar ABC transporter permease [Spirochaetia bacterium]|nr:sugar ABC transporter permease [Spirochaetia bacterium]
MHSKRNAHNLPKFIVDLHEFVRKDHHVPYVFNIMMVMLLILLFIYPLLYALISSFVVDGNFSTGNYQRLIEDPLFRNSLLITFLYVTIYTVGIMCIGFITALAIDISEKSKLPGTKFLSSLLTLPYAIPDVVGAIIWMWLLNPQQGAVNYMLSFFGSDGLRWLTSTQTSLISVIMVSVWRLFPMHTLIILSGFKTVPQELYEAAELEGANIFKQFYYVTIPYISNILKFLVLLTIVWSFKRFAITWLLTQGGPMHSTETLPILIYQQGFRFFNSNYASAIAIVLLFVVGVFSIFYMKNSKASEIKKGGK